jgi:hypothetical protein
MTLVKEFKGVKIFVSHEGEFYCDAISNSGDYKKKTFSSMKLQSIEKVIGEFMGQEIDGSTYYDIQYYAATLHKIKIVRKVGDRLFFDDGTDTSNTSRRSLYPKSVDEKQEFSELVDIFDKIKKNQLDINTLYEAQKQLKIEAEKKLKCLPKVSVLQ